MTINFNITCTKYHKLVSLTFDVIETTTLSSSHREGIIGIMSKCSLCKNNNCQDCPHSKEFEGLPINLN